MIKTAPENPLRSRFDFKSVLMNEECRMQNEEKKS
jgi:hypothetical protein